MCGIAGIVEMGSGISEERLKKMTNSIAHRGPDAEGRWINDKTNIALGHRRLSILDLSNSGDQPMHFAGKYTIVFNGEIYNYIELKKGCIAQGYSFRSQSDTEVLLALYDWKKEDCLQILDGMFSFAIYNSSEETLFCARDRFGEKPFFYSYAAGKHFVFGSEMKALWSSGIGKQINDKMLFNYLAFNLIENPGDLSETFYKNCNRLPHSHYLKLSVPDCKIISICKYYDIDWRDQDHKITETQASETFEELFYTSVHRRLRSDVAVGSSLSGGLDSSIIVCVINELKKGTIQKQKTFSSRFPGFSRDEGKYIDMITAQTQVDPHFTFPDSKTFSEILPEVLYHQEEPFAGPSVLAQYEVMKLAKQHQVTVLLDGQGADEMLAGYHYFYFPFFKELFLNNRPEYKKQYRSYKALMTGNDNNEKWNYGYTDLFKEKARRVALNQIPELLLRKRLYKTPSIDFEYFAGYRDYMYYKESSVPATLNQSLYESMFSNGMQQLLRFADRNSMAHSREVRLPFLYHKLVEFVFSLPTDKKINNGWTKYILRKTFDSLLPHAITWRRDKIGYAAPDLLSKEYVSIINEKVSKLDMVKDAGSLENWKKLNLLSLCS